MRRAARVIALVGALPALLVTLPLYTGFDRAAADFQFVELRALDRRASTSTTTSASTAYRCC